MLCFQFPFLAAVPAARLLHPSMLDDCIPALDPHRHGHHVQFGPGPGPGPGLGIHQHISFKGYKLLNYRRISHRQSCAYAGHRVASPIHLLEVDFLDVSFSPALRLVAIEAS